MWWCVFCCCCTRCISCYYICQNGALSLYIGTSFIIFIHSLIYFNLILFFLHTLNLCYPFCRNQPHQHELLGSTHPSSFVLQDVCRVRQIHWVSEKVSLLWLKKQNLWLRKQSWDFLTEILTGGKKEQPQIHLLPTGQWYTRVFFHFRKFSYSNFCWKVVKIEFGWICWSSYWVGLTPMFRPRLCSLLQ